jgi:hypothetical protein
MIPRSHLHRAEIMFYTFCTESDKSINGSSRDKQLVYEAKHDVNDDDLEMSLAINIQCAFKIVINLISCML